MSTTSQECDKLCLKAFGKILSPPSGPAREADKNFIHRLISLTLKGEALRYPPAACGAAPALKKKTTWESVQSASADPSWDEQNTENLYFECIFKSAGSQRLGIQLFTKSILSYNI